MFRYFAGNSLQSCSRPVCHEKLISRNITLVASVHAIWESFHSYDSDQCICDSASTALHYATKSDFIVSSHMWKPAPNFEHDWLKRVTKEIVCRQKNSLDSEIHQ
ncbi:hypothetical protein AVEN_261592-1 [Araneus ventricosus]|uniref:Uncharacterized protein n=1 Tax=Araneus ventricosus TaxID=182803 RepID=A0A4Y2NC01_ARAVE|nr:hypothetical protein AVEN_261592-1 [Araneus ventricosus]